MFENNKVLSETYSGPIHANLSFIKTLSFCRFVGFFGHVTEMIGNNNPNFLEFARLVSRESFHYLISTITALGASGISIRLIRNEKPYTYF